MPIKPRIPRNCNSGDDGDPAATAETFLEDKITIKRRIPMPQRLAPPLSDPVVQDGHLLYANDAFDPKGLSERVFRVTSCPRIKAQHAYARNLGKGVGSFNFGVVPHMGIPGMYLYCCPAWSATSCGGACGDACGLNWKRSSQAGLSGGSIT